MVFFFAGEGPSAKKLDNVKASNFACVHVFLSFLLQPSKTTESLDQISPALYQAIRFRMAKVALLKFCDMLYAQ